MGDQSNLPRFTPQQLDDVRSRVSVSSIVGQRVKLSKSGREFSGLCPFHTEKTPSFTVNDEKGFWHCFGCGAHGDVIRWMTDYENIPFVQAVQQLAGEANITLTGEPATSREMLSSKKANDTSSAVVTSDVVGKWAWDDAVPAVGELPEKWFESRDIDPAWPIVQRALRRFRYHPRMPYWPWKTYERPSAVSKVYPALLVPIEVISGLYGARKRRMIGVHCTYLADNGYGKAYIPPARSGRSLPTRKIWGDIGGGGVMLSGVDGLDGPVQSKVDRVPLVVGEGLESTLDAMLRQPGEVRGCATLSLNNFQGRMKRGASGELRLWNIEPEPECGAFLFDDPGAVISAIDADMKAMQVRKNGQGHETGPKVQERRGERWKIREVTARERSDICAALTVKNWRSVGAYPVTAIRPPMGYDFNDRVGATV